MPIAVLGHPTGALEVRLPAAAGAVGLRVWIAIQDDAGDFALVGAFGLGVKQAQIGDEVVLVIRRDFVRLRHLVGDLGVEFGHVPCPPRLALG